MVGLNHPPKGIRYRLLELLYGRPMTNYAVKHQIKTALIGNDESVMEGIHSVFSLGQALYQDGETIKYYDLFIDTFTQNGTWFRQAVEEKMPGLGLDCAMAYARITCMDTSMFSMDRFSQYHYVIFCGGIPAEVIPSPEKNQLIAVFQNDEQGFQVYSDDEPHGSWLGEAIWEELNQLNLNQKYTNILARSSCDPFSSAIKKQNEDYNKTGKAGSPDRYDYDSSFSCTAHMPYRLALFGKDPERAVEELSDLLSRPESQRRADVRYQALIMLEHRRWNAHMIAEGFVPPERKDFLEYAYRDGNTHKKGKLHPCICDGGMDPFYLEKHPDEWDREDFEESEELSELDKFSIRCHRLCVDRAREMRTDQTLMGELAALESSGSRALEEYRKLALAYIEDEHFRGKALYDAYRERAKGPWGKDRVEKMDKMLEVFKARNARKDYSQLDVNIIDGLYFDLWHMRKYQTVLVACTGTTARDVLLPFSLSCRRAVFLLDSGDPAAAASEEKTIRDFFAGRKNGEGSSAVARSGDTEPVFERVDLNKISEVRAVLRPYMEDAAEKDQLVFDCTDLNAGLSALVFGQDVLSCERFALLKYNDGEVIDCRTGKSISCGIKKCVTADEFLALSGAKYENPLEYEPSLDEELQLFDIFREFSRVQIIPKAKKKGTEKYCVWTSLANYFTGIAKNTSTSQFFGEPLEDVQPPVLGLKINSNVFQKFRLDLLLRRMQDVHLLANYKAQGIGACIEISFESPDTTVRGVFHRLSVWGPEYALAKKLIEFSGNPDDSEPLRFLDNKARAWNGTTGKPYRLFEPDENLVKKKEKIRFMNAMKDAGIVQAFDNPAFLEQDLDSGQTPVDTTEFEFSSVHVKRLFQLPGKVFELLLYQRISDLGIFSQVKKGVQIAWDGAQAWDFQEKLDEYFRATPEKQLLFGLSAYKEAKAAIQNSNSSYTTNEIDLILMKDMSPVFISCKTGTGMEKEWLYEIAAVSRRFRARPVMAVSFDLEQLRESELVNIKRAKSMGISLFGAEIIHRPARFRACMEQIAAGKVVSVLDYGASRLTGLGAPDGLCRKKRYRVQLQLARSDKIYNVEGKPGFVYNHLEDALISVEGYNYVVTGTRGELWPIREEALASYETEGHVIGDEAQTVWTRPGAERYEYRQITLPQIGELVLEDGNVLKINGDRSEHGLGDCLVQKIGGRSVRVVNGLVFADTYEVLAK